MQRILWLAAIALLLFAAGSRAGAEEDGGVAEKAKAALGLPRDASAAQVLQAIQALKNAAAAPASKSIATRFEEQMGKTLDVSWTMAEPAGEEQGETRRMRRRLRPGERFREALAANMVFAMENEEDEGEGEDEGADDEFLRLGTKKGLGGRKWQRYERSRSKDLIRSFIPPLLRPAFVGHAFVLPPNAWQVQVSARAMRISGDDFFKNFESNDATFKNFEVHRQFADLDFFYGFDLNKKYLHNFTVRLNIPFRAAQLDGFVHPNGFPLINAFNEGHLTEIGDIGLFLKKKFLDQAEFPIQIAGAAGLRFPTGSNEKTFTNGGRIKVRRPDPTMGAAVPPPPPLNMPIPVAMLAGLPTANTPFPFNGGIFNRFSGDGRLPTPLQPGTGTFSAFAGLFFTRVNQKDFILGRSAFHWGATHTFRFERDGIDPGDQTTAFFSFVKPVVKDLLSFDLGAVFFHQEEDRYDGRFIEPVPTDAAGNPRGSFKTARFVTFRSVRRPSFAKGWTGFIAPSFIISPDPSIRFTISGLARILKPELGPAPDFVIRLGMDVTF